MLAAIDGDEGTTMWPPSLLLALAEADRGFNSVRTPMFFQPLPAAFVVG